jgi:ABC-type lipoprotein export system ATPase subunit
LLQKIATLVIVTHSEELARLAALHISMLDGKLPRKILDDDKLLAKFSVFAELGR